MAADIVTPPPPQTVHCNRCDRDVVITSTVKPGIFQSECKESACPINSDPDNQPSANFGTDICFVEDETED
jgi:hypothetical protein